MTASAQCPLHVRRAAMEQRWECLTFLHWRYDPDDVRPLLPPGLTLDEYDGAAWVGLVPFRMRVSPPRVPAPPWLGRFCETNVRTYVRDAAGRPGVWFFSLDAARLAAVLTARVAYSLPYYWSRMRVREDGDRVVYDVHRRWPGRASPRSRVVVRPGPAFAAAELGERDHFLTARWRVFSATRSGAVRFAEAEHLPWPLRRVEVVDVDDALVTASGLRRPEGAPLAHFSDAVDVRIGMPRSSASASSGG